MFVGIRFERWQVVGLLESYNFPLPFYISIPKHLDILTNSILMKILFQLSNQIMEG